MPINFRCLIPCLPSPRRDADDDAQDNRPVAGEANTLPPRTSQSRLRTRHRFPFLGGMRQQESSVSTSSNAPERDVSVLSSSPPKPRLDLTDRFATVPSAEAGKHSYEYGEIDVHGLTANLSQDGTLSFDVYVGEDRASRGGGKDMFISLMQRLERDGLQVRAVDGNWLGRVGAGNSVNLDEYVRNLSTMEPQEAARSTWTGRLAADFGYTEARIVSSMQPMGGGRHYVQVQFTKPARPDGPTASASASASR